MTEGLKNNKNKNIKRNHKTNLFILALLACMMLGGCISEKNNQTESATKAQVQIEENAGENTGEQTEEQPETPDFEEAELPE